jgi:3-deoxy-manno-octulosonate cytidylyltransferase (CMP-KDO synthetase)
VVLKGRVLGVIPARLGSSRLPRKPLHPLAGRPLVEWVWRRSTESRIFHEVVIATDSVEVAAVARDFGAVVEMTRADHPSGTDRVAEVASRGEYAGYGVVVNVQGDEPFVSDAHLAAAVDLVVGGWPIGTIATAIGESAAWRDPAVVKVVCGDDGAALLFTRAPVPHPRGREPTPEDFAAGAFLRHIGIYAYTRDALETWVRLPEGRLERMERLEQLRPLAHGMPIGVGIVDPVEPGIDTPEDAARADRLLRESAALTHLNGRATP